MRIQPNILDGVIWKNSSWVTSINLYFTSTLVVLVKTLNEQEITPT